MLVDAGDCRCVGHRGRRSAVSGGSGFTLIEFAVTLIVASIVLAIGIPSYQTIMANTRASALASDFRSGLVLARSEAVRRGQPVLFCPSTDGLECDGSWTDGWVVRVSGAPSSDPPLRSWGAPIAETEIVQTPVADTEIEFGALGERVDGDAVLVLGARGCFGDRGRRLEVTASGRVIMDRVACP